MVRKKVFRTAEGVKQLYYAVQRVLQRRGGVTAELLAQRMASRKGMSSGDVQSVLIDLPKFIEEALMEGESVTINDVMPGKVRLSRVYFRPDKSLVARLNSGMDFYRYPLSRYFPHDMLRPETLRKERAEGKTGIPDEDPVGMENDTEDFVGEE